MARALADIITEISSSYNPLRDRANKMYNEGVESTVPQEQADMGGLETARTNAFESINTGANRRGMFFSGIPLAEQGKFVGENYLPSIVGLKNRYAGIRGNLYQTLSQQLGGYDTEAAQRGQGVYQQELDRDEQVRQFNETLAANERAAAAARAGSSSGSGFVPTSGGNVMGANTTAQRTYQAIPRSGGGFNFTDVGGQAVSAATYAKATGIPFRDLLTQMANSGDAGAKTALGFVGNDFGYDPNKVMGKEQLYNNLIWGSPYAQAKVGSGVRSNTFVQPKAVTSPFKGF